VIIGERNLPFILFLGGIYMEWMVLLQQIFEMCIIPLLGVLTLYIV
jgi:hypothetical protein